MAGHEQAVAGLEQALNQTYDLLRQGDFAAVAAQIAATEAGVKAIAGLTDAVAAARLRRLAERNARCLQAAAMGVRAARRRLTEVLAASSGLQTYNGQGETTQIGKLPGALKARL